jgi:hypothetical protein
MVDNIGVCVHQHIQVFDAMKILMNVRFSHSYVEMVERKLWHNKFDLVYLQKILYRCVNEMGSYRCYCATGWHGPTCAKAIDYCLSQPCNRNGTCINTVLIFFSTKTSIIENGF